MGHLTILVLQTLEQIVRPGHLSDSPGPQPDSFSVDMEVEQHLPVRLVHYTSVLLH